MNPGAVPPADVVAARRCEPVSEMDAGARGGVGDPRPKRARITGVGW